ncbi:MAG: DEAD/DEAH box helicase [Candidatus Bipolaricaulota bacterium]|nr:DEAD/DEAH box helicase [Candidatus Bipolaricaulota bacterium]MDW8152390.1 DEAD/DEAH box helicase [Candidatus Bipolaricaulota bacterium]
MRELLTRLEREGWYRGQVGRAVEVPPRPGVYAPPPAGLPQPARAWLEARGLRLFRHQAEAMEAILSGKDVILATGPSSGKTLAMALPVLAHLAEDPTATALLLYPLKALAQDQLRQWREIGACLGVEVVGIYDGDTPAHVRPKLRGRARILLTNPYALHQYLEWHHLWAPFLARLRYVVLDEAHWYQGAFGSGVALLLWRLQRILRRYGAQPLFVLASATCGDPAGLARALLGREAHPITADGSPQGPRTWWFWDPDRAPQDPPFAQVLRLCGFLLEQGLQTLVFVPSRRRAEALSAAVRAAAPHLGERIAAYRAGYLPEERRALEAGLRAGTLRLVVSTCALELGVDIGGLDAVVLVGYPGSLASARQQAGRAGRAGRPALLVYVPEEDPLDYYFLYHPEELVFGPVELPVLNPRHRGLLFRHLVCAAAELPLRPEELGPLGVAEEELAALLRDGPLARTPAGLVYAGRTRAVDQAPLEALSARQVRLLWRGQTLEVWDEVRARREAFPGAVLLHQGQPFRVRTLDLAQGYAELEECPEDYTTRAVIAETVRILRPEVQRDGLGFGTVEVREEVRAYKVLHRGRLVDVRPLQLPPVEFQTEGIWLVWPTPWEDPGALHGAEHALVALVPLLVGTSAKDVGGVSAPVHPDTGRPTILIYDGFPDGIGISRALLSRAEEWVRRTAEHLSRCPCKEGCPRCVLSARCGSGNRPMDKAGARDILERWLKHHGPLGSGGEAAVGGGAGPAAL